MPKKIGISYWGFCEKFENCNTANTPDGHRYGRPMMIDEMLCRNHQVTALQKQREKIPYPGMVYDSSGFPDLDILFIEWRWPTWKNSGERALETDLKRQIELLDYYHGKIPVIAWDTDLQITAEDELRWPEMILADPCLDPTQLTRARKRLTFWTDYKEILETQEGSVAYGYIGNNYNRERQFRKYYGAGALGLRNVGVQTMAYGNWMQHSPERAHPRLVVQEYPHLAFVDRVGFQASMNVLNRFICTTHISKKNYAELGNVTVRYFETLACNVPALVPADFYAPEILGKEWKVSNPTEVFDRVFYLMKLSKKDRQDVVEEQRYNLKNYHDFHVASVVDFIESVN